MVTDEIAPESWKGDINSFRFITSATVGRFSGSSLRYRSVHIYNSHGTNAAYIGWYNYNSATFVNYSLLLAKTEKIKFEFIDLYELGAYTAVTPVTLKVLCLNEY